MPTSSHCIKSNRRFELQRPPIRLLRMHVYLVGKLAAPKGSL